MLSESILDSLYFVKCLAGEPRHERIVARVCRHVADEGGYAVMEKHSAEEECPWRFLWRACRWDERAIGVENRLAREKQAELDFGIE